MAIWKWFAVPQYSFADEHTNQELLGSVPLSNDGSPVTQYSSLHQRKAHYFWWGNRPFCTHCGERTDVWRASSETNTNYECMQCGVFRVKHVKLMSESEVTMQNAHKDFGNWETEVSGNPIVSATPTFQEILFNQMTSIFQYMGDRLRPGLHPDAWRAALMLAKLLGLDCLPPKNCLNLEAFGLEDGRVIDPDVVSCAYIGTRVLDRNSMCWGAFRHWKKVSWQRTQAISRVVLAASMPPPDWTTVLPVLWTEELVARSLTKAVRRKLKVAEGYFWTIFDNLHEVVAPNVIAAAFAFLKVPAVRRTYNLEYWDKLYENDFRRALAVLDVSKKLKVHPMAEFPKSQEAERSGAPNQSTRDALATVQGKDQKVGCNLTRQHKAQELEARFRLIRTQQQQRSAHNITCGTRCPYGDVLVDEGLMCRLLEGVDFAEELHQILDVLRTDLEEHLSIEQRLDYDLNQLQMISALDVDLNFLSMANLKAQRAHRMNDLALERASKAEVVASISSWLIPIPSLLDSHTDAELRNQLILWNQLALLLDKPLCIEDLMEVSSRAAMVGLLAQHIAKFWRDYNGDEVEVARPAMRKMVTCSACQCFDVARELPVLSPVAAYEMDGPPGLALLLGQARWLFRCVTLVEYYLGEGVWGEHLALLHCHPTWAMLEKTTDNMVLGQFVTAAIQATEPLLGQGRDEFQLMDPAVGSACRRQEEGLDRSASAVPHRHRLGEPALPPADTAQQVVPFLRQLLSNGEVCQPAVNLRQCSTSAQLAAALNALGMPFSVEEKVLNKAVEVVRLKKKFDWMYRPIYQEGPLQPWTSKCGKNFGRKQDCGKRYALYSVRLLAPPEKVAAFRADLQSSSASARRAVCGVGGVQAGAVSPSGTDSSASPRPKVRRLLPLTPENKATLRSPSKEPERLSLAGFETTGQLRERCRAAALELVPAALAMLADRTLCRTPTCLGECSTALEVGRQLLRRLGSHPIGVKYEAVVPFLLEHLCDNGALSRLEMGSAGAPLRYTRHPYQCAKRRDPQSGRSSDLWSVHFFRSTEAPASSPPAAGSNSSMGPILEALMPPLPAAPVAVLPTAPSEPDSQPPAEDLRNEDRSRKKQKRKWAELDHGGKQQTVPTTVSGVPLGDARRQCRTYAEAVLPAMRNALQQPQGWGCCPPRTLDDCLTTHEFGRRLLAKVGPLPSKINEEMALAAILRRLLKEGLVHRAGQGEGTAVIAVGRDDDAVRWEDSISGKSCLLLFVSSPASTATSPSQTPSGTPSGDVRRQCQAYAEAVLPAVRHALRQPQGWGHRPPRTLDDCLTTHEFGRRLLALVGPHPAHLEEEAVTAAILKCVVEEGLVHRAGLGEGRTVVAVRRADVARREDAVNGKACQLLFVSPCEASS